MAENNHAPTDGGRSLKVAFLRRNEDREDDTGSNEEDFDALNRFMSYESHGETANQEELVFDIQTGKLKVSKSKNVESGSNRNPVLTKMAAQGYF